MKNLLTIIFAILIQSAFAQADFNFYYGIDLINIGKNSIAWNARDASSIGLKVRFPYKEIYLGGTVSFTKYNLSRPDHKYKMEMSKYELSISRSFQVKKKLDLLVELHPYARYFNTDLFSASLKVDECNFGLGLYTGLNYVITKKLKIGLGYSIDRDIFASAMSSSEITDNDRFIKMTVHSLLLNMTIPIIYRNRK